MNNELRNFAFIIFIILLLSGCVSEKRALKQTKATHKTLDSASSAE